VNQKDLALIVGISKGYLGGVVSGKRDASKKLAHKLGKKTGSPPEIWIFGSAASREKAYRTLVVKK